MSPICEPCSNGEHDECTGEVQPWCDETVRDCNHDGTVVFIQPDSVVHEGGSS